MTRKWFRLALDSGGKYDWKWHATKCVDGDGVRWSACGIGDCYDALADVKQDVVTHSKCKWCLKAIGEVRAI